MYDIFYISSTNKDSDAWLKFKLKYPTSHKIHTDEFNKISKMSFTKMFWAVWEDVDVVEDFDLKKYTVPAWDQPYTHVFSNGFYGHRRAGVCLFPKNVTVSNRELNYRFFVSKKEVDIVASTPRVYDQFVISTYEDYVLALEKSTTEMFWCIWPDVEILDNSVLEWYFDPLDGATDYDRHATHIFKNSSNGVESFVSGIILSSKFKPLSKREIEHRFPIEKKEQDIVVSIHRYPRYLLTTYDDYIKILESSNHQMFWGVWPDTEIIDNTVFDLYFNPRDGKYDYERSENHIFKNYCNDTSSYLSGVILFSKDKVISKKEFSRRYLIDKKEHDVPVSRYRYPRYLLTTYDDYIKILESSNHQMFWGVWPDTEIIDNTVFDLYFNPRDGKYDYERSENHIFKNYCNDTSSYLSGVILFSKDKVISKKEFSRRYLIDKKEHDVPVSRYRYPRYTLSTYEDYLDIFEKETSAMFWCIWSEIEITDNTVFDLYFDPNDGKYDFDRGINHVFKNQFRDDTNYNGLMLMSKAQPVSKKEIDFRFLISKKQHESVVSKNKLYDIVFISYNEPTADNNYQALESKFPNVKRVHGVKGIHQAHIRAAEIATTEMFWVVDGDAVIVPEFDFTHVVSRYERDIVHVWRSQNPLNHLTYGYGGVKLLPRDLTLSMDVSSTDMTTSISPRFKAMPSISNITAFNTDAFSTWRSAFRECVKLSSKIIDRQDNEETIERLDIWCTIAEGDYAQDAINGAIAGRKYGETNRGNTEMLSKINDFDWLKKQYGI
jgi:hypothetical protein